MRMVFLPITLKIIVCSLVMFGYMGSGYAADPSRAEEKRLIIPERARGLCELHDIHNFGFSELPSTSRLKEGIKHVLERYVNINELQERCQREVNALGSHVRIRLYCSINFSLSTCSIFASCEEGPIPLRGENTLFLSLIREEYEDSQQAFLVQEEICPSKFSFCHALGSRDASPDEAEAAKRHLLARYAYYKAIVGEHPEYTKAFLGYREFLENPEEYENELKKKKVVFTQSQDSLRLPTH